MKGRGHNWRFKDLTGQKFGRLTVLRRGPNQGVHTRWYCQCDCGSPERLVRGQGLTTGGTTSCGCFNREQKREITLARNAGGHGQSARGRRTKAYVVWNNMVQRCTNPDRPDFVNYGGRGITVCERWLTFENFHADVGDPPAGKTLDRADNDKGYAPDNVRWATRTEQVRNQRKRRPAKLDQRGQMITFRGETHNMSEWARRLGISKNTMHMRLKKGWPVEAALTTPLGAIKGGPRGPRRK